VAITTAIAAIAVMHVLSTHAALAATARYVSPQGSDVGDCTASPCRTIGYAIGQAGASDVINIAAGTYSEHLVVDRSLTFAGAGSRATVIDGSGAAGEVVFIGSASHKLTVAISRLAIVKGSTGEAGGGLASVPGQGLTNRVSLARVIVAHNSSTGDAAGGGGIYNGPNSSMTIRRSKVLANIASASAYHDAHGGGILNAGTLDISNTTISDNSSVGGGGFGRLGQGGGIYNADVLSVTDGVVSGNIAQGGAGNDIVGFPGGEGIGGGIYDSAAEPVILANVTLSGNRAKGGDGGWSRDGVGGNGGDGRGGALRSGGSETLLNVTLARNRAVPGTAGCGRRGCGFPGKTYGGGIDVGGSPFVTNTILADNSAQNGRECFGSVTSGGHNLLRRPKLCDGVSDDSDLVGLDPLLGPLGDYGGLTFTMPLQSGSPAIDAADDAVCSGPPVDGIDQRGTPRPVGPHCDIGAFEAEMS
jgi:hypothetical protein